MLTWSGVSTSSVTTVEISADEGRAMSSTRAKRTASTGLDARKVEGLTIARRPERLAKRLEVVFTPPAMKEFSLRRRASMRCAAVLVCSAGRPRRNVLSEVHDVRAGWTPGATRARRRERFV